MTRLILERIASTYDAESLQRTWQKLTPSQRLMPDVAAEAALRWLHWGGAPLVARQWLQVVVLPMLSAQTAWRAPMNLPLVRALDASLMDVAAADAREWLSRIESVQQSQPRDPHLQYLAGMLCWRHCLWGKAQSLLSQAVKNLTEHELKRKAWCALAELAEQRQDADAAAAAWKKAALVD